MNNIKLGNITDQDLIRLFDEISEYQRFEIINDGLETRWVNELLRFSNPSSNDRAVRQALFVMGLSQRAYLQGRQDARVLEKPKEVVYNSESAFESFLKSKYDEGWRSIPHYPKAATCQAVAKQQTATKKSNKDRSLTSTPKYRAEYDKLAMWFQGLDIQVAQAIDQVMSQTMVASEKVREMKTEPAFQVPSATMSFIVSPECVSLVSLTLGSQETL